jgi:hypothetical protein
MNCQTPNCNSVVRTGRLCSKCRSREYRAKHPVNAAYLRLRYHAKERGISFSLTLEYFTDFCQRTNYLALRGIGKNDLTIDRIDATKGYEDGNIQVLTNSENKKKDIRDRKGWFGGNAYYQSRNY